MPKCLIVVRIIIIFNTMNQDDSVFYAVGYPSLDFDSTSFCLHIESKVFHSLL